MDAFRIYRKSLVKGDDGFKTFSIRVRDETVNALDELSRATNRSRNELINLILKQALDRVEVVAADDKAKNKTAE
jgi:predicted transcriptional regulator